MSLKYLTEEKRRVLFAKFAKIAYKDSSEAKGWGKGEGFTAHKLIDKEGAQVHVFHNREDIVVTCRGTEPSEMNDIYADLEVFKEDSVTGAGQIHEGFKEEVDKVWDLVKDRVNRYDKVNDVSKRIWVAGHSLGGAMGTIIASRLEHYGYDVDTLYTYGSPRAGGPKFRVWCDKHLNHQRFVNNNDVVPCVPSFFRWKHSGKCNYIKSTGEVTNLGRWSSERIRDKGWSLLTTIIKGRLDIVSDHNIDDYIMHLEKQDGS